MSAYTMSAHSTQHNRHASEPGMQHAVAVRRKPVPGSTRGGTEYNATPREALQERHRSHGGYLLPAAEISLPSERAKQSQKTCYCGTSHVPPVPSVSIDTTLSRVNNGQRPSSHQSVARVVLDREKHLDRSQLTAKALKHHLARLTMDTALAASSSVSPDLVSKMSDVRRNTGYRARGSSSSQQREAPSPSPSPSSSSSSSPMTDSSRKSSQSTNSSSAWSSTEPMIRDEQWPLVPSRPQTQVLPLSFPAPKAQPTTATIVSSRVSTPSPTPSRSSLQPKSYTPTKHKQKEKEKEKPVLTAEHTCRFSNCGSHASASTTSLIQEFPQTPTSTVRSARSTPSPTPYSKSSPTARRFGATELSMCAEDDREHEPASFFDDGSDDEDGKARRSWRRVKSSLATKRSSSGSGSGSESAEDNGVAGQGDRAKFVHGGEKFMELAGVRSSTVRAAPLMSSRIRAMGCGMFGQGEWSMAGAFVDRLRGMVLCGGCVDDDL